MASRESAYRPQEVAELLSRSSLRGWRVTSGPIRLLAEGIATATTR